MAEPTPGAAASFNFKNTIAQMVQRNASDLLLKVGRPPTVRLNGELNALGLPPIKPEDLKALAEQIMTPRQVKEFAEKTLAFCRGDISRKQWDNIVTKLAAGAGG